MFKVTDDTIEYDGWTVGTLGNMPATVRADLTHTLHLVDEECAACADAEKEIREYQEELEELRDEIVELKERLAAMEEQRDAYRAILQLPPETER